MRTGKPQSRYTTARGCQTGTDAIPNRERMKHVRDNLEREINAGDLKELGMLPDSGPGIL